MPTLEDSGFDSEDRQSTAFEDVQTLPSKCHSPETATTEYSEEVEVAFRGVETVAGTPKETQSKPDENVICTQPSNTCRILQRKLELKVERAKRNFSQYQEEQAKKSQSANLIPINRLAIPGDMEPLVDYKSDSSGEPEEISFFPAKLKRTKKQRNQELTDTFSIQEMTIDSELDSEDSDAGNLELLPPNLGSNMLDKLKICFGCSTRS